MGRFVLLLAVIAISAAAPVDLQKCIQDLKNFEFEPSCVQLLISKALGYGVIVGSSIVKLPQIVNIVKSGSVAGLSLNSFYFEVLAFTLSSSYAIYN
jgi:mannose-P-dolichol utilization defect protein 1